MIGGSSECGLCPWSFSGEPMLQTNVEKNFKLLNFIIQIVHLLSISAIQRVSA